MRSKARVATARRRRACSTARSGSSTTKCGSSTSTAGDSGTDAVIAGEAKEARSPKHRGAVPYTPSVAKRSRGAVEVECKVAPRLQARFARLTPVPSAVEGLDVNGGSRSRLDTKSILRSQHQPSDDAALLQAAMCLRRLAKREHLGHPRLHRARADQLKGLLQL